MIKLRDPHDDAKLAMRELNDDIVAQPEHPCEHLQGFTSLRLTCSTTRVSGSSVSRAAQRVMPTSLVMPSDRSPR